MVQGTELQFFGRLLRQAWLRRWWLLGIVTLSTAGAAGLFFLIPPRYRSETIISVEREKVINPLSSPIRNATDNEERLKTLNQEIHSRTLIEKLLLKLGLEGPGTDPLVHERNIQEISDNTTVNLSRFDSFKVSYSGGDPRQVRDITNALAGIFIEENLAFKEGVADSTYSFLTQQLEVYRKKLEDSEIALRQFEEKHLEVLPEAKNTNQARLDMLKVNLDSARQTLNQERIQKDLLIKRIPGGGQGSQPAGKDASTMLPNPLISTLQEKEDELQRLRQEYSDRYPDVIRVQADIESLKKEIARNPTVAASSIPLAENELARQSIWEQIRKLDVDIEALRDREAQLEREIARYQERVQTTPQVEQELSRLRRDYNVNSDIYDMFLRRVEEARVTRELESSKKREIFRVLEPAVLPLLPYRPDRTLVVLGGLAAGLGLCILLVYLQVARDTSFQGLDDARKNLSVPVLGGIQWSRGEAAIRWRKVGAALYSLLVAVFLGATAAFILWRQVSALFRGGQP